MPYRTIFVTYADRVYSTIVLHSYLFASCYRYTALNITGFIPIAPISNSRYNVKGDIRLSRSSDSLVEMLQIKSLYSPGSKL